MKDSEHSQGAGVLAPYVDGFETHLRKCGYSTGSRRLHLRLMRGLGRRMGDLGLGMPQLGDDMVEGFVRDRRAAGYRSGRSSRSLTPLLEYLRGAGVLALPQPRPPEGPVEILLAEYRQYLIGERGLAASTVQKELPLARSFLAGYVHDDGLDLSRVTADGVIGFMLACVARASTSTVQRTGTALRSLLRFLRVSGRVGPGLADAVPAAANWKLAALPKYLTAVQVDAMLASRDTGTTAGLRDAAVLRILSRMGLRAGEVESLKLRDIDWRRGEVTIHGKGNHHDRLPLPEDVGMAIVAYLRVRVTGIAGGGEVFVGLKAPHGALTRFAVTQIVARTAQQCGLGTVRAHRLRHTAATAMLQAGASLDDIGQVLRHQHVLTTAIYAKIDHDRLRPLARPWPGEPA